MDNFKYLKFKTICNKDLIKYNKYFIKMKVGRYYEDRMGYFVCYCPITHNHYITMNHNYLFNYLIYRIETDSFIYEPIKQKQNIQYAMETRAINKLLQRITGDKTFKY